MDEVISHIPDRYLIIINYNFASANNSCSGHVKGKAGGGHIRECIFDVGKRKLDSFRFGVCCSV